MNVAFDLDGTLVTAEERQSYLLKAVARRYGIDLDCGDIWENKRSGMSNSLLLEQIGVCESVASAICCAWLREIESSYWLSLDTLFKDTIEALDALRGYGFCLVLVTARQNEYLMRQQVYRLGIDEHFDNICCVTPKSAIAEKAGLLRCTNAIAFIGDSETDFKSSQIANVPFYGVCTGQRSEEYLLDHGLMQVSRSLSNVVNILLEGSI